MSPGFSSPPHHRLAALLACLLIVGSALAAEAVPDSAASAIGRAAALLEAGDLDAAQRQEAQTALDAARAFDAQADDTRAAVESLREAARLAEQQRPELERRLQSDPALSFRAWRQQLPDDADGEQLERLLAGERSALEQWRGEVASLREALSAGRDGALPEVEREAELSLQIASLQRRIAAAQGAGELPPALLQARAAQAQAQLRALAAERLRRQVERDTAELRRGDSERRLRQAQRELGEREQRIEVLQALIAERQQVSVQTLLSRLRAQSEQYAAAEPSIRDAAALALALGEALEQANQRLAALRQGELARSEAREDVAAALRGVRARLALEGQDEALGLILVGERRRLAAVEPLLTRIAGIRADLARVRLQQITLDDLRDRLADIDMAVAATAAQSTLDDERGAVARGVLHRLYGEQGELLPRLDAALQRLTGALEQAESTLSAQLADTRALRTLLDRSLPWTRSHAALDAQWPRRLLAGIAGLIDPARLVESLRLTGRHFLQSPLTPVLALALAVALVRVRRKARAMTIAAAPLLRRPREDSYLNTLRALAISIGYALPPALLVWALGYVLRGTPDPQRYASALGKALVAMSSSVFLIGLLRALVFEQGLGHLHFRWLRLRRDAIARALPWLRALFVPLQGLIVFVFAREHEPGIESLGRLLLFAFYLLVAWAAWRLLAADALWPRRGGSSEPNPLRRALRALLPAALLAMLVAVGNGHLYSGRMIADSVIGSVWISVLVLIVHGLLSRWILLGERRLALCRMEERREAARKENREEPGLENLEPALDLETVNAHASRLLRALTIVLWVGGLLWVWAEVLPALGRLDEIVLWRVGDSLAEGSLVGEPITLKGLLLGLAVLMLTVSAARNLPGLLEIGLLSRAGLDAASRYGITTVSRYAIVIIGMVLGLGLLGMRWSQLQWLAAALTVGLGFGLQEIFANFVSGLIVLWERPFRVGDTVTIGGQTGVVTRISTRATTLRDGDGLELIIPNKAFITERLSNWTLSDTRTRLVVKIGVGYEVAPREVQTLLQEIAQAQPQVLAEPAPKAAFVALGPRTMDFELRVFVGALNEREAVLSGLHARIVEAFAARGIDLSLPPLEELARKTPSPPAAGATPA